MSASLSDVLLKVATAIAADGGASVRAAVEGVLREAVPFDGGELAFVRAPGDTWRQPLGTAEGRVLGADLLDHVIANRAAYRIDDWRDAEPFAETLGLLRARALRSLLVVPFRFDGPGRPPLAGALAVARSHGWAFVGASLPLLTPFAAMAGLALDRALVLTTLGERARALEDASSGGRSAPVPEATPADPETTHDTRRDEVEALRGDAEGVAASLREERAKVRDLIARAETAESRLLEAERSRDEWARKATSAHRRAEEQDAELQSLRRGIAGARETAASAADVAEAAQARIRELQERASEQEGKIRALEGECTSLVARLESASAASADGRRGRSGGR